MGRRGRHEFLDHWHNRSVVLAEGRTLTWVAMTGRAAPAHHVECFRLDGHPVDNDTGARLLRASGHPDAALRMPGDPAPPGGLHR